MSLSTYDDLLAGLPDYILRDNISEERLQDFVRLAEGKMDLALRCRELKTSFNTNISSTTNTIAIPSDYNELILVQPTGTWESVAGVTTVTSVSNLQPMVPVSINTLRASDPNGGYAPTVYAETADGDYWQVWPSGGQYTVTVWYFQKVPKLSDSNQTNDLIIAWPDLYLAGAMVEAELYLKTPAAERGQWGGLFAAIMEKLNQTQKRSLVSGGTVRTMPAYGNR